MKELQYLNKFFIKYKFHFFGGILITIVAQIFSLFTPKLISDTFQKIENNYAIENNLTKAVVYNELVWNILLIIGTTMIAGLLQFLMRQSLIVMSRHVEFDLKNEVFQQYERLTQNFYKKNRTGDLMNRISEDVSKVRMYVGPAVMYSINTFIRFAIVIIYMYNVSPKLTLYTILPLPFLSFAIFRISTEINKRSRAFQENLSNLSTFSQEVFSGIRVLKAYGLERNYENKSQFLSNESKDRSMKLAIVNAYFGPLMICLIGISNLVVIYVGGSMYIDGSIESIGVIAEFILYVNMLTWPVASLGWVSSMVQEAEASQKRINEFMKIESEIKNTSNDDLSFQSNITFKDVNFDYEDTNVRALNKLNLTINKGETVAILGKTGSGKSTLLTLLTRLYDVTDGSVLIDSKNIKDININQLRSQIGMVPQDTFLFSDSIKNNIKFGKANATDEEVFAAAKNAMVHKDILNFKQQYETVLGERGITLSGGQKQRVSIARAIIKDPQILIFDDSLSAVDTETEEAILNNLFKISQNKTTIIVTHRVASAKNADKIFILDEGTIVQQGTHNQLVDVDGFYKDLYVKQLSEKN